MSDCLSNRLAKVNLNDGRVKGIEIHEQDKCVIKSFFGLQDQTSSVSWLASTRTFSSIDFNY